MERLTEIHDILNKMQFFNQRAGRELWNDKPASVQDEDIANRDRDIEEVREFINNIVEQLKVENQGLLLKLPCKVGDTVYAITPFCEICEESLDNEYACENCCKGYYPNETKFDYEMISMVGKRVFLTEQEAQAALEKMKAGGVNG